MSTTFGSQEHRTSYTSFSIVAALHLALLAGLIYGLNTVTVRLPHETVTEFAPVKPDTPLKPNDPVQVKVELSPVAIHDFPTQPEFTLTIPDGPTTTPPPSGTGGSDGHSGTPVGVTTQPADVFTGAVADAKSCDKPEYPRNSLRNGDTGVVTLELLIGTDGKVSESKVLKSSGHRELDQAAVAGLSLCKFTPAKLNGQPQKSWAKLQYAWNVENQ